MQKNFITRYRFKRESPKHGRALDTAKVGGVNISRLDIEPGATVGNLYFMSTSMMFFVERGRLRIKCYQINTRENCEMVITAEDGIIHVPPQVGFAIANIGNDSASVVVFSDKPLRDEDDVPCILYK